MSPPIKTQAYEIAQYFGTLLNLSLVAHWPPVTPSGNLVNIGLDNGLLPGSTKLWPDYQCWTDEPMLNHHQWRPVLFTCGQSHKKCWPYHTFKITNISLRWHYMASGILLIIGMGLLHTHYKPPTPLTGNISKALLKNILCTWIYRRGPSFQAFDFLLISIFKIFNTPCESIAVYKATFPF